MSVIIETTLGDITVDLFIKSRPVATWNFLKLCQTKHFNYNLFHTIQRDFIAQTGDQTGVGTNSVSVFQVIGTMDQCVRREKTPIIRHSRKGLVSFVGSKDGIIGSQFFITLGDNLNYLDELNCVFGEVVEGLDVLDLLNEAICDGSNRPYKDIRITHTVVLHDPFPSLAAKFVPDRSPSPSAARMAGGRIAADEEVDELKGKQVAEIDEMLAAREATARATILEIVGDIPNADVAPPDNVLFVCKLNPVTSDDDLEIIFGRFGKILSCEVIRDKKSGESLEYAFIEFENPKSCEDAYFKMDNVLIDDRRIHVDFSQSVAKVKWLDRTKQLSKQSTADDERRKYSKDSHRRNEQKAGSDHYRKRMHSSPERRDRKRSQSDQRDKKRTHERSDKDRTAYKYQSSPRRRNRSNSRSKRRYSGDRSRTRSNEDKKHRSSYGRSSRKGSR